MNNSTYLEKLIEVSTGYNLKPVVVYMNKLPLDEPMIIMLSKVFCFTEQNAEIRLRFVNTVRIILKQLEFDATNLVNIKNIYVNKIKDPDFVCTEQEFSMCFELAKQICFHQINLNNQLAYRRGNTKTITEDCLFLKYINCNPVVYNNPSQIDKADIVGYAVDNCFIPLFCDYETPAMYKIIGALNNLTTIDSGRALLNNLILHNITLMFYTDKGYNITFEALVNEGLNYNTNLAPKVDVYQGKKYLYSVNVYLPNLFINSLLELNNFITTQNTKIGLFADM